MKVQLNRGRVYSVEITGDFTGPYINLELSPQDAYDLLQELYLKRDDIADMAKNYYTCRDCADTHPNTVKTCPNIDQEQEQ